jgi:D-sedoheptulose 7-phosphate isomerase
MLSAAASRASTIAEHFHRSCDTLERAAADRALLDAMAAIADMMIDALRAGGKILVAGNGGSAADAQHIAGEFLSRLNFDRSPLPAFERQIRGLARKGDVFIAISTSGRSLNIIRSLEAARQMGVKTIGFTGISDSEMVPLCDLCLRAPSDSTPQIQQIHIVAAHAICGVVESELFGKS